MATQRTSNGRRRAKAAQDEVLRQFGRGRTGTPRRKIESSTAFDGTKWVLQTNIGIKVVLHMSYPCVTSRQVDRGRQSEGVWA